MRDIFKTTPLTPPEKSNLLMWHGGYQGGRVFHNDGADYVDCGRLPVVDAINNRTAMHTIELMCSFTTLSYTVGLSIASSLSSRLFSIGPSPAGEINLWAGNSSSNYGSAGTLVARKYHKIHCVFNLTNVMIYVDGAFVGTRGLGATFLDATSPLTIGAISDGSGSATCDVVYCRIYSGTDINNLVLIDSYDFTDPNQWDGGGSGTSLNGNAFTVTDGTPTGAGDYAYSKEFFTDNYAMYQYSTGNINPNPTGNATLTSLGFTNSYMTKASLSALHNGTTIFTSDASAPLFRMLVYSALTDTQKALDYVRR